LTRNIGYKFNNEWNEKLRIINEELKFDSGDKYYNSDRTSLSL